MMAAFHVQRTTRYLATFLTEVRGLYCVRNLRGATYIVYRFYRPGIIIQLANKTKFCKLFLSHERRFFCFFSRHLCCYLTSCITLQSEAAQCYSSCAVAVHLKLSPRLALTQGVMVLLYLCYDLCNTFSI